MILHKRLSSACGKSSQWYAPVIHRLRLFRIWKEDVKDKHHSGRQISQSAKENVQKVSPMMLENWQIGIESIVQETGFFSSYRRIWTFINV